MCFAIVSQHLSVLGSVLGVPTKTRLESSITQWNSHLMYDHTVSGRGFVGLSGALAVALKLRDPTGRRVLRSAALAQTPSGAAAVTVTEVDSVGETVVVEVSRASVEAPAESARTVSFSLVALLQ